jgi:hypothetical protein
MSESVFTVEANGLLTVDKREGQPSAALDEILSTFAEPVDTTALRNHYRVTAASIWKARRQGLSLEDITHTLETYCETDIPADLLADVERWSRQIDRLRLETDQGRLVLRSHYPLLIPAMLRQRTLRRFIKRKIDTHTLELKAETEPDLIQAFDDAQYPILDQRHAPHAASTPHRPRSEAGATGRRRKRSAQPHPPREVKKPQLTAPLPPSHARGRSDDFFDVFPSQLEQRCQAITRTGRRCRNRVRPPGVYCRIHDDPRTAFRQDTLQRLLDTNLVIVEQMALFRLGISVAIVLSTWLLNALFMWIGAGWLGLPLAPWYTIPITFLLTCWLADKFVFGGSLKAIWLLLFVSLASILLDFFNKEGLILNICFVLIPFVLPLYLLYRYSLSGWWGLLLFPVGIFAGWVFYHILEQSSE